MLRSLARTCYEHRRLVVGAWVLVLATLVALSVVAGGETITQFKLPGSESQDAFNILKERGFESRAGQTAQIVFTSEGGIDQPAVKQALESMFAKVREVAPDTTVDSPYDAQNARQVSPDRKIAYAQVNLADRRFEDYPPIGDDIKDIRDEVKVAGLTVELGGDIFVAQMSSASEVIGVIGAVVILLVAFGSLLAMGLPIVTALFGIGCGVALVGLASNLINMPSFITQAAAMIGIGVGIDYALFIVTRYRQGLSTGLDPREAVSRAMDTSGRAVLFAGSTVMISLYGMLAMNLTLWTSLAIGMSFGVLMTMLATLTLLPAMLGFVGRNIDRFGLPHKTVAEGEGGHHSMWYRWSRLIQRYPWVAMAAALTLLLLLAIPVFSMRFGFGDAGNRPESDTTRRAYDLLSQGFGPGFNGPLLIAAELPGRSSDLAALGRLSQQLNQTEGVAFASPPIPNQAGDAAIIQVFPTTSPQDEATARLVHHLRRDVVPPAVRGSTAVVKVGGLTAGAQDFAEYSLGRLPVVMAAVLVLCFLLLTVVFRSLVVPLKAVLMNLLSIGAAYGIVVLVFQWGVGAGLVGVGKEGPIDAWMPLILYSVVFGLSMDYEVFLLSRVREEYDKTRNNALAVADGLAVTARVISAAAAIMVCVFLSFALGPDRGLKLFGVGLASAVFVDATVVRLILVPATMELLGDWNWWLPSWLERVLPRVRVEGPVEAQERERVAARA